MTALQHASLTPERWSTFDLPRRVLMVGNEMNRAGKLVGPEDGGLRRNAYERVLRLIDLTIEVSTKPTLRRELLRWRDLAAALYIAPSPSAAAHRAAFRSLLLLTAETARQIPFLLAARDEPRPA